MGCDIHLSVEYAKKPEPVEKILHAPPPEDGPPPPPELDWRDFVVNFYVGRRYDLFARLADVRNYNNVEALYPKRGMPHDPSHSIKFANLIHVAEVKCEGSTDRQTAARWIASGSSKAFGPDWVTNPDYHSHGHASFEEFDRVIEEFKNSAHGLRVEWTALHAAAKHMHDAGYLVRYVWWFDN